VYRSHSATARILLPSADRHTRVTQRTFSIQGSAVAHKPRATRCSTANVQVDSQCGKLATELSRQRFASKVANFQLLQLHLTYSTCIWRHRWGRPRLSFAEMALRDPTCGRFGRTPTCDRQTAKRTDRQTHDDS